VTNSAATSKAQIVRDLNADATFTAAATASLSGDQLVIKSKGNSSSSTVAITTTLFSTNLGLSVTPATAAAASTGADLRTQVQADGNTASGATTFGSTGAGSVVFRFEGSGLSSPVDVTLATLAGTTVTQALSDLSSQVANNATLKAAGISLTTATAGDALVFTSSKGEKFDVAATGDVQNRLGAGSFVAGIGSAFDYAALTGSASYSTAGVGTGALEFSINGGASAGNSVAIDLSAGDATAASIASTDIGTGNVAINPNNNTLNIVANGVSYAITLATNASATKNDIAQQITAQITGGEAIASVVGNAITLTSSTKGASASLQIENGTANTVLGFTAAAPVAGVSRTGADVASALNTAFAANSTLQAAGLTADYNVTVAGKVTITSNNNTFFRINAQGDTAAASVTGQTGAIVAATAGSNLGSIAGPYAVAAGTTDVLRVKVDAGAFVAITLTAGAARTAAQVASDINNSGLLVGATASVSGGKLLLTSNTTGAASAITIDTVANGSTANTALGFGAGGVTGTVTAGAAAGTGYAVVTGSADTLDVTIDGVAASVVLTNGSTTAASAVTQINTQLNAQLGTTGGVYAAAQNNRIQISSLTTGTSSSVVIGTGNANTILGFSAGTTTGTQANIGYGVAGATFVLGNTATAAPAVSAQIDAGGSNQSSAFAFAPVAYGGDDQTISVTANDSTGAPHSLSTILHNDATNRSGRSIDSALNAINTALQQSNDPTLQNVVAVKDNASGVEKIRFLDSSGSFKVSVGTTANATGFGSQGTTDTSTVSAGGSTADISTQSAALNAVSVLASAVSSLGSAQAVVGRGQNQFNYAINLAQSQLSNLASAESRIRDADLASEAANLTKAQILLQAGVAALAQANSAPQAVLALLRG
jgi:flagellin